MLMRAMAVLLRSTFPDIWPNAFADLIANASVPRYLFEFVRLKFRFFATVGAFRLLANFAEASREATSNYHAKLERETAMWEQFVRKCANANV